MYQGFEGPWEAKTVLNNLMKQQGRTSIRKSGKRYNMAAYLTDLDIWEMSVLAPEMFDYD